jgi:hypothetical protein
LYKSKYLIINNRTIIVLIESERETAYLLKSQTMKQRLLEAKNRQGGMKLEEVCEKLGI